MTRAELIHDERTKLLATWLNSGSVTVFGTGVLAPVLGIVILPTTNNMSDSAFRIILVCLVTCFGLKLLASVALGRMITNERF